MVKPYDISTVVSRSYISEQMQDQMQKSPEHNNAQFLNVIQKEADKKSTVSRSDNINNATVKRKKEHEEELQRNKKKKKNKQDDSTTTIDIKV